MDHATFRIRALALGVGLLFLAGCEEGEGLSFLKPAAEDAETGTTQTTKLVERDVEAPDVFQVNEAGLWDGRPSLGGVWVAHPDASDPERVIIRNNSNGKFVIGALFRREREIPGPRVQASSDAAAALGMLAGAPVELNVTALRRESVSEEPEIADAVDATEAAVPAPADDGQISESALDPIAGAAAAIDASEPEAPLVTSTPSPAPAAVASASSSTLSKPFIQIGIFSVEANANSTASQMQNAGVTPTVYEQSSNGKKFWRVVVGPAQSKSQRASRLKKVKAAGFTDAYAVTN